MCVRACAFIKSNKCRTSGIETEYSGFNVFLEDTFFLAGFGLESKILQRKSFPTLKLFTDLAPVSVRCYGYKAMTAF